MLPSRNDALVVGGIALAVLGVLWWVKGKLPAAARALNPGNPDNVVNSMVTDIVQGATNNPNQTLMGWFDDTFGVNQGLAPGESVDADGHIVQFPSSLRRQLPDGTIIN